MLCQNNGHERLGKEFLALIEISRALISQFEFSELLSLAAQKIVNLVQQTEIHSKVFWGQSLDMFRS